MTRPNFTKCVTRLTKCADEYHALGDDPMCRYYGISPFDSRSNKRHERDLERILKEEGFSCSCDLFLEAKARGLTDHWLHFNLSHALPPCYDEHEELPDTQPVSMEDLVFCPSDPGTGEIYHCDNLNCPMHGERNRAEAVR